MDLLKKEGLFGAGLVSVVTPPMVERYNRCLADIGIAPTECKAFQIDGVGWSPQVAEEKGNLNYLSHGEANQFAVILTPDQEGKPIYAPTHSFDFQLMGEVFRTARPQIANLTTETALWLDIDQQIDHYHSPLDLLMLEAITVRSTSIDRIIQGAREQRNLVAAFRDEVDLWMDTEARGKLIESAQRFGDLRFKPCIIPEIPFVGVRSFFTKAFDGVFVFRDLPGFFTDRILILENVRKHGRLIDKERSVFGIDDPSLYHVLEKFKLIEMKADAVSKNPSLLDDLRDNLLAEAMYRSVNVQLDLSTATSAQKKGAISAARKQLPDEFFEIDDAKRLAEKGKLGDGDLSKKLKRYLARPHRDLDENMQSLVWMLLMKMRPIDLEMLYRHSKQQFYKLYASWPEYRRKWAVAALKAKNLPNPN